MSQRSVSVHIKNLPRFIKHQDLYKVFGRYGKITDVTIPLDYHSGEMRGYAFLEYADRHSARDAIEHMNRTSIWNRVITLEYTRGYRKTPAEMRLKKRHQRDGSHASRSGSATWSRSHSKTRSPSGRRNRNSDQIRRHRSRSRSFSPRHTASQMDGSGRTGRHPRSFSRSPSRSRSLVNSNRRRPTASSRERKGRSDNTMDKPFFWTYVRFPDARSTHTSNKPCVFIE